MLTLAAPQSTEAPGSEGVHDENAQRLLRGTNMAKNYDEPLPWEKDYWNLSPRQREILSGNPFAVDPRQAEIRTFVALERIADALEAILPRLENEKSPRQRG